MTEAPRFPHAIKDTAANAGLAVTFDAPLALDCGDRVELLATGAYVTTYASQAFNGFRPLAEHYV